jgi:nitrogen fixation/metabolism regulation signal transduction histidine kinase
MEPWLESFARTNFRRSSDTAHDLKTPLNVAVLNLELLRMRVSKLAGSDDEKVNAYARSIEQELRRMARIFDAFFVLSTPPKSDEELTTLDVCALSAEAAVEASFELAPPDCSFHVSGHESRIRQAFTLFFEGAARVFREEGRQASVEKNAESFSLAIFGNPAAEDFEMTKIFKFYYTDALGNPDLSLAAARLIAETYGGELNASEERDKVVIRLSFPSQT